jgi:hypothetical protein
MYRKKVLQKCKLLVVKRLISVLNSSDSRIAAHNFPKHPGASAYVDQTPYPQTPKHISAQELELISLREPKRLGAYPHGKQKSGVEPRDCEAGD